MTWKSPCPPYNFPSAIWSVILELTKLTCTVDKEDWRGYKFEQALFVIFLHLSKYFTELFFFISTHPSDNLNTFLGSFEKFGWYWAKLATPKPWKKSKRMITFFWRYWWSKKSAIWLDRNIYICNLKSVFHIVDDFCQISFYSLLFDKMLTFVWLMF